MLRDAVGEGGAGPLTPSPLFLPPPCRRRLQPRWVWSFLATPTNAFAVIHLATAGPSALSTFLTIGPVDFTLTHRGLSSWLATKGSGASGWRSMPAMPGASVTA